MGVYPPDHGIILVTCGKNKHTVVKQVAGFTFGIVKVEDCYYQWNTLVVLNQRHSNIK